MPIDQDAGVVFKRLPLLLLLLLPFQLAAAAVHARRRIAPEATERTRSRASERFEAESDLKKKNEKQKKKSPRFFVELRPLNWKTSHHIFSPVSLCLHLFFNPLSLSLHLLSLLQDEARRSGLQAPPGRSCPSNHAHTCATRPSPRTRDGEPKGPRLSGREDVGGPARLADVDGGGDVALAPIPCSDGPGPAAAVHHFPLRPRLTR